MSCPKYKNYIRECAEEFMEIMNFPSFDFCESDEYGNCPIYKIIEGKAKPCEFFKDCMIHFSKMPFEKADFKTTIMEGMNRLCLSDKNVTCAIYKLRKTNKNVPKGLLPDGLILEFNI